MGKLKAQSHLQTAQFLKDNPVSKKARASAWANILVSSFDDETKKIAIGKIESLGGKVMISDSGKFKIRLPEKD